MATRLYLCRRCAIDRLHYCPNCRWLNVLAREAEERIELLLRAATIDRWPMQPGEVFWLLWEREREKEEVGRMKDENSSNFQLPTSNSPSSFREGGAT